MNKKIQFLIAQYKTILKLDEDNEVWYSSSQNLENNLKQRGIVLQKPLFYEYKLPNGISAPDYLQIKNPLEKFSRYKPGDAENLAKCLANSEKYKQDFMKLSAEEKAELDKYFVDLATDSNRKIDLECKKIRELNPELRNLDVPNNIEFLSGVIYGFAPEDIKYFCDLQKKNLDYQQNKEEAKKQDLLAQDLGLNINWRISPETIQNIRTSFQQSQQTQIIHQHNGHE